jgi:glycosyltransferase involved in cell wall biosynthesis
VQLEVYNPLISVLVPCYKSGEFLKFAIDSILLQKYESIQIIVINQGGDEATERCVSEVAVLPGVEVVECEKKNAATARNFGLVHARGDYIAMLDADDSWAPGLLKALLDSALANKADCVFGETELVDENAEPIGIRLSKDLTFATFLDFHGCPIHINSILARAETLREIGGFDESLDIGEDWDILQRIARTGRVLIKAPGALAYYTIHSSSTTSDYGETTRKQIEGIGRRVYGPDRFCARPSSVFSEGLGEAAYHLEMLSMQVQIRVWSVLEGDDVPPLSVSEALYLHWYRQPNVLESVVRATVIRYRQAPISRTRHSVAHLIPKFTGIFDGLIQQEKLLALGLTPVADRITQAIEPEFQRDMRMVMSYLTKGYRKYLRQFFKSKATKRWENRQVS